MKADAIPHWTSDIVSYNSSTLQLLQKSLNTSSSGDVCIFGGIGKGGKWAWLARNSNLEIIDPRTGNRTSAFCFGHSTGNTNVSITCVKEYEYRGSGKLAVGLRVGSSEGMLCIYDPRVSRVVMAVDIPHVVTAVEPVTSCGGTNAPNFALNEHLRCFFGIVAVGTKSGHIFLVDLCLDEEDDSDEMSARQVKVVTPRTQDVEALREKLMAKGDHLGQEINSNCHTFRSFNYDSPSGKTLKSLYPSEVSVTAMKYIPQIGSLAVGFNFGGFQLWKLSIPMIEYCSPLTQQAFPVTHFAYQEPEDDPQYFCYVWVGRGPLATDASQDVPTSLHLFQLSYDGKEVFPRHGHIYRDLTGCVPRFQYDLTGETGLKGQRSEGCRLITCTALAKDVAPGTRHEDSTMEEEDNHQDLSLAAFAWEAPSDPATGQTGTSCFLGLFDLNRWYHAQMPLAVSTRDSENSCSYLAICSLESVMEAAAPDVLLDLHIDAAHVSRYLSTITPAPEQHFHPSALSFDVTSLMETGVVSATFLGAQHQVLGDMTQLGPSVLREPQSFYNRCWASGLLVKRQVLDKGLVNLTPQTQRETLLSIALDHNLIGFLMDCINSFAMGDFESGCTLRSILDWAWSKVANIKQSVDQLCIPLYDGFGSTVDEQTMKHLDQHSVQMGHMITIFQSLLDQSATTTEQGLRDLEMKYGVVTLICQHLQVVLWFVKTGLLPECSDDMGDALEGQFCYPAKRLHEVYAQRRTQLQKLCKNNGNGDILMIDGLVSQVGAALRNLWDGKQGSGGLYPTLVKDDQGGFGLYPPPSFHAMLDMYLLENVPLVTKHCIVGYFLLDIIFTLTDVKYEEMARKIELFYQCFSLPLGIIKMLQGFWYLDHKDFDQAIEILVDPAVHIYLDASPWQHRNVIRAFLYYNESKRALQYIRTARPALLNPEDVELHLTVLLANKLTGEAFEFQRQHRDVTTSGDLLHQLFLGSQQTKTMDELLKLPFDEDEDAALVRYLQQSSEPNSQELLVMHYLQRGRYVEAIRANERLKQHSLMDIGGDSLARERTCARNVIVESYSRLLPGIQRKLAFGPETGVDRTKMIRREVVKPKPLSSVINPAKTSKVISHGLLVNAVLDRIAEAHVKLRQDETPTKTWPGSDNAEESSPPMEPFIGTPITPRNRTSRLSTSVVYPKVQELANDNMGGGYQTSQARAVSFMAAQTSVVMPTPVCLTENYKRPPIDYSGATALSLLQTPTITKLRTQVDKPKINANMPPTPQSILKVRRVARRSPGPSPAAQTAVPKHKVKGISVADMVMPTPPIFNRKQLSFAADISTRDEKKKTSTPVKRISFADETFGKSPSPEPKTTIHYTAMQQASPGTPSPVKTSSLTTGPSSPLNISPSMSQRSPSPSKGLPTESTSPQFKIPASMPIISSSPPRDADTPPMDISPTKEPSPPRGILTPPKGTSPPREPSPARSISPEPTGIPAPMDTSLYRDTPTPPFLSPASSPPRFSDSPPKQVSFAPIPMASHQSPFVQVAGEPRSDSPTDDMFEQAVTDQMVVDDEITFNITTREEELEEEKEKEEEEEEKEEVEEDQMETDLVIEQETGHEIESKPTTAPSKSMDDTDTKTTPEKTSDDDEEQDISLIPSPRPPIHPLPESSSPLSWQQQHHSSHSTPPRAEQQVLQSFPTPPSASHEPQLTSCDSQDKLGSDLGASPTSDNMPPPHQRLFMPSTFAPTMTRSFGVSPFVGTGAFSTQEGVQTSPMAQSILFGRSALTTEMSAQTTPGLALRENDSPSRPRTSFAASLQSSRSNVTPPPSGRERNDEVTDQEIGKTRDANAYMSPMSGPQIAVKHEPLSPPDHMTGRLQQIEEPSFVSSPYTAVKQEPISPAEQKRTAEPDSPDGTTGGPSFIFSPPTTRSRARRSAHKSLAVLTTPAVQAKPSFLMPTPGPTPSDRFGKTRHSSTPKRATSRTESLDTSTWGSVGKTSTSVAKSGRMSSAKQSPRSRRKTPSVNTPEDTFASPAPSPAPSARRGLTESVADSPVTRLRTRKSMAPSLDDSTSDVILLSPVDPSGSAPSSSRAKPKKVVRVKHTMTLRTTPKKSTRNVKLW